MTLQKNMIDEKLDFSEYKNSCLRYTVPDPANEQIIKFENKETEIVDLYNFENRMYNFGLENKSPHLNVCLSAHLTHENKQNDTFNHFCLNAIKQEEELIDFHTQSILNFANFTEEVV